MLDRKSEFSHAVELQDRSVSLPLNPFTFCSGVAWMLLVLSHICKLVKSPRVITQAVGFVNYTNEFQNKLNSIVKQSDDGGRKQVFTC